MQTNCGTSASAQQQAGSRRKSELAEGIYEVAIRALFLGFAFCCGIFIAFYLQPSWQVFGYYMCFLSFFHYSEFLMIAITNPRTLSLDSFVLNHSREYAIAAISSWVEFFIEWYFFPGLKQSYEITYVGIILCIAGEGLRKLAMLTAKSNFTHIIQSVQEEGHQLVTHGVYSYCRHPSYVGWFYWSIGTQLILVNPICITGYILASWQFFRDRILIEEVTLLNFFGEDYYQYQKKVPTGLPYIQGYKIEP
ncbi:Protein-S-isoprenylcysteine O-methyltransferase [Gryllus bimaculatus]|nr:Protein-S-isoprenylcysteine O-methyltransferase [Gryllus bimaculatus]